jgi:two-component system, sensor histidine kinase LadS
MAPFLLLPFSVMVETCRRYNTATIPHLQALRIVMQLMSARAALMNNCLLRFLVILSASLSFDVTAAEPVNLGADQPAPSLRGHLSWYRDSSGALDVTDLIGLHQQGRFTPAADYPSFGYTRDIVWITFSVRHQDVADKHWLLSVTPAFLDQVQLFRLHQDELQDLGIQGDRTTWQGRETPWRNALFPLDLIDAGETRFYLKIDSTSSIAVQPKLWQTSQFVDASAREMLLFGLLISAGILLCALSLFFLLMLKQRLYLYFFFYIAAFTFIVVQLEGVIHLILRPDSPLHLEWLQIIFQSIGMIAMALMFSEIAELSRHHPRNNILLVRGSLMLGVLGLIPALLGHDSISILFYWLIIALLGIAIPVTTFVMRRQIGLVAYPYTAAFAVIGLGLLARFIWVFGATGENSLSENNFPILMLLHVAVMFIALAAKYVQLDAAMKSARNTALTSVQQSERHLEGLVRQRTLELDHANQSLAEQLDISHLHAAAVEKIRDRLSIALEEEKRVSLEQKHFLRMVAHEFRTPLSVIQMAADMIRADPRTPDIHASTNCDRIQQAGERMAALINQALREDKLDSVVWRSNAAFVPVSDIVHQGIHYATMVSAERHAISVNCIENIFIQGDRELLVTLINNILDNAVKYSPTGSRIELSAYRQPDNAICIQVRDYGRGMTDDERLQVLEKYFRSPAAADVPGMGLGLYLVDRIVRLHSARLDIDSSPGVGTVFTVYFPPVASEGMTKNE